jgi:hypothetical protein
MCNIKRLYGYLCQIGLWNPQVIFQITPLCWGFGLALGRKKIACYFGPIAIAIWFTFSGWKAECTGLRD